MAAYINIHFCILIFFVAGGQRGLDKEGKMLGFISNVSMSMFQIWIWVSHLSGELGRMGCYWLADVYLYCDGYSSHPKKLGK